MSNSEDPPLKRRLALLAVLAGFIAYGTFAAYYVLPGDDEWGYVVYGQFAASGQIRLYQDDMLGYRLPLPFYLNGLPQTVVGKSLLAPRLVNVALAAVMLVMLYGVGCRVVGPTTGILAVLFVATNGTLVGYYARAAYFSVSGLLIVGGLLAIAHRRPVLGMFAFGLLSITRAHLAVLMPVMLVYLLATEARTTRHYVQLISVAFAPGTAFLAWSPEHWKVLAYVPMVCRLVEPFGYRSLFELGALDLTDTPRFFDWLSYFIRHYAFWVGATIAIAVGCLALSRPRPPRLVLLAGALSLYAIACSVAIIPRFATSSPDGRQRLHHYGPWSSRGVAQLLSSAATEQCGMG